MSSQKYFTVIMLDDNLKLLIIINYVLIPFVESYKLQRERKKKEFVMKTVFSCVTNKTEEMDLYTELYPLTN